jgi:hypothetical protein
MQKQCDVDCDVTLACLPVQLVANQQCSVLIKKPNKLFLRCNLDSLIFILSFTTWRTVAAEVAGSSPAVPAILFGLSKFVPFEEALVGVTRCFFAERN